MKKYYCIFLCASSWFFCCKPMETEWENYEQAKKNLATATAEPCVEKIDCALEKIEKYSAQMNNDKQLSELLKNLVSTDTFLKKVKNEKYAKAKEEQEELDGNPITGALLFNEKKFVMEITLQLRTAENEFEEIIEVRTLCFYLFFKTKKVLKESL